MTRLIIITSEDLITQKLQGNDIIAEIKNPRDSIDSRIASYVQKPHTISFKGVEVFPRMSPSYPNPTLMHFALARYIGEQGLTSKKVLDLGCGVGFLGNFAAKYMKPEEIFFGDLNPQAVEQAFEGYLLNNRDVDVSVKKMQKQEYGVRVKTGKQTLDLRIGDVAQTMQDVDAEGQIALTAPYFIPGFCENFPEAFQLFGYVAKNTGAKLLIGHSSTANSFVEQAASSLGLNLRSKQEQEVPFLVEYSGRINQKDLPDGLIFRNDSIYHNLMISEMSKK